MDRDRPITAIDRRRAQVRDLPSRSGAGVSRQNAMRLPRVFGDAVISVTAVLLLIVMLVSVDDRVRDRVSGLWAGSPHSSELADTGRQFSGLVTLMYDSVKDQSVAHAPLTIFTLAATVLVVFMLRT